VSKNVSARGEPEQDKQHCPCGQPADRVFH
jgi:hypothetical protein